MNDLTLQGRLQPLVPPQAPHPADGHDSIDFMEYWRAVSKRRWPILGLTLVVTLLALLVVNGMRPTYRGTATLLIEQGKAKFVSIEEVYSQGIVQREYFQTQIEILKSQELARKAAIKLDLVNHPDFDPRQQVPGWQARFSDWLFGAPPAPVWTEEDLLKN